ncbi:Mu transposase C-terminal domain-containing protein, partial [Paraburkholderia sp. SIMBA_049]
MQADGLTQFHVRYWHPIFVAWRETRRAVTVRIHPEDLSRVFVAAGKRRIPRSSLRRLEAAGDFAFR